MHSNRHKLPINLPQQLPSIEDVKAKGVFKAWDTTARQIHITSTFDMCSGFFGVGLKEEDRHKTAFATWSHGLMEWCRMPQGLCNSPGTFQWAMQEILRGLCWKICVIYIDDCACFSHSCEEHLDHLVLVLERVDSANIAIKTSKCIWGTHKLPLLGHLIVVGEGILPDSDKISAMADMTFPKDVSECKSFLGACSYYRRFIPNFAVMAEPIRKIEKYYSTKMTKVAHLWEGNEAAHRGFNGLKAGEGTETRDGQRGRPLQGNRGARRRRRLAKVTSLREGNDFEVGKGELCRGRGRREGYPQVALRGALAQGWQGEGMVQIQRKLNRKKRETVGPFSGHHMAMSGSQTTKGKAANQEVWAGDVETEWAEPISEVAKEMVSKRLEGKLKKYGGQLTQAVAVQVTLADRTLQRLVKKQGLDMRAADVAWAWVAQQVRDGRVAQGETVFRPEIGVLADTEGQVLCQLVAQARTGWDVGLRRSIDRRMLSRMVLSRQVLKSTYRVREREMAERLGMTIGQVWDLMGESTVEMTKGLAAEVWRNANKQAGLAEGG